MEQVALSGGQSGSECVEYSISQYSILTTTNEHIINIDRQAIKKGHLPK